jgi:SAM-dependent methyltransferase
MAGPRPAAAAAAPDVETASAAYARRFAGPVGEYFLGVQADTVRRLLAPWPRARVADVGGGHGQLAARLADDGHRVVVVGSAPEAAAGVADAVAARRVEFQLADLLALPFPDRGVDVAVAVRLLPHVERWRELVRELCRVAARAVVVDYPSRRSVNAVAAPLFGAKKSVEGDTRPFAVFRDADVADAFGDAGWRVTAVRRQFALPMALHRALGSGAFSRGAEAALRALGLTALLGSPVILRAERRG